MRALGLQVVRIARRFAFDDAKHIQVSCCREGCGSVLRARICERTEWMGEIVHEQVKRATTEIILADIIDFSLLSAEKQYAAVRNMTGLLDSRLRLMSGLAFWRLDEIVLSFVPTGEGFYILLQPLAAGYGLFLAISLRSSILTGMEPPELLKGVRFAVHVGECFAFRDITGKENWIGPGLNECARLISAQPEQSPNEGIPADQSLIIVSAAGIRVFPPEIPRNARDGAFP